MKPLGIPADFSRVIVPTQVEDAVWEAVSAAIAAGWTPSQFRIEAAEAWGSKLRDEAKHAEQELSR